MASKDIERIADFILDSDSVVVFTGAGVSTESGIPDFRSPGGIWDKYDPNDFRYEVFINDPGEYWKKRLEMRKMGGFDFSGAEPNPAHLAIAELEELGKLSSVITQNVDNLHQKAGNKDENVIELHGSNKRVRCLECGSLYPAEMAWDKAEKGELPPKCECGGVLKTDTVLFGEPLPREAVKRAKSEAENCDLMIVVGSSLVVYPASSVPQISKKTGSALCIINLQPTNFDSIADVVIHGKAGEILPKIMDRVKKR